MVKRNKRYTVYDMMEDRGEFEKNPANIDARDGVTGLPNYVKAEFPMMLYSPKGEFRVTVPAEIIATPLGPRRVGEQRELISKTVGNEAELKEALAAGWHKTPAGALRAGGVDSDALPPPTSDDKIAELEAKIRALELERNTAQELALSKAATAGATVKMRDQK